MGEKNRKIREHIFSVARTHRPAVEEAWIKVLQRSGLERARAETVLWLTLSVVRGLAIRSLWQPDLKRFRRLLDEWSRDLGRHGQVAVAGIRAEWDRGAG